MESRKELDCERLELLLIRRHIDQCKACRVELINLLDSDPWEAPRRRESDKNMSEEEWKRVAALRSEAVRRHALHPTNLDEPSRE